jgi:hypothetical protein
VQRTLDLFAGIVSEAKGRKGVEPLESYHCRVGGEGRVKDPDYTIRAWRAVVTICCASVNSSMSNQTYQSRRDFLRLCGLAGLGVSAPMWWPGEARAESAPYDGPYYLVFNASGGWDHDLSHGPEGRGRDQPALQGR